MTSAIIGTGSKFILLPSAHAHGTNIWGVDSVKSTVTLLEEGDFTEEGFFRLEGVLFCCRIPLFVEEECILISRRGSCASRVGGHTSLGGGVPFDLKGGSIYIIWSRGVTHFC